MYSNYSILTTTARRLRSQQTAAHLAFKLSATAHLVAVATEIDVRYLWRPNLRDEGDNFVLEIAVAAWPCTIVTHNVSDFSSAELRFPQVVTCTPGQLMQSLTH